MHANICCASISGFLFVKFACSDPNAHIVWIENVNARVKALRDIEEGMSTASSWFMNVKLLPTNNAVDSIYKSRK